MADTDLLLNLLEQIPAESISVRGLSYKTKIDRRTIKKYINVALAIQNMRKIVKLQDGFRVLVRKEL